ncbi:hypothetical protein ACFPRL_13605 [Pseudoclavibacter helvolus]
MTIETSGCETPAASATSRIVTRLPPPGRTGRRASRASASLIHRC